jgi:hypothetical protein
MKSKGEIRGKLRGNLEGGSAQPSLLFFSIFIWHGIIEINMFPIYLSIAMKEVGGGKDRLRRGAPWA